MKKKYVKTSLAPSAIGPYSQAISCNSLLFVSGQLPLDPKTGQITSNHIKEQTKQVLENAKAIIEAAGLTLENVVKCSCFLKNMSDFFVFNEVYGEYFNAILPARECVEVSRLPRDVLVEISVICAE